MVVFARKKKGYLMLSGVPLISLMQEELGSGKNYAPSKLSTSQSLELWLGHLYGRRDYIVVIKGNNITVGIFP